jgi:hypothetical protein
MPDVRHLPVFALILIAMLGNSGMACACALGTLDTPVETHHGNSGEHAVKGFSDKHDCEFSCSSHAVTAPVSKASDATDYRTDKPVPPAAYFNDGDLAFVPDLAGRWRYEKQHPLLPLSTPVSRSDILLD